MACRRDTGGPFIIYLSLTYYQSTESRSAAMQPPSLDSGTVTIYVVLFVLHLRIKSVTSVVSPILLAAVHINTRFVDRRAYKGVCLRSGLDRL